MNNYLRIGLVVFLMVIMTLGYGGLCKKDKDNVGSSTPALAKAKNPIPANGATGVSIYTEYYADNDPRATSFDVYFGTTNPPPFLCTMGVYGILPVTLSPDTTYYWCVDSKSSTLGIAVGDVWTFKTAP